MAKISTCLIAIFVLCFCIAFEKSYAKPAELEVGPDPVSSITVSETAVETGSELQRDQRSPGDPFDYGDDYDDGSRHYKHHHKPHGCKKHGHGCGEYHHKPSHGGEHGSFAVAGAGSISGHGGSSQAQAASINFGPISFSAAQAQSLSRRNRYNGAYRGYGGYGGNLGYGGYRGNQGYGGYGRNPGYGGYGDYGGYGGYGNHGGDYFH